MSTVKKPKRIKPAKPELEDVPELGLAKPSRESVELALAGTDREPSAVPVDSEQGKANRITSQDVLVSLEEQTGGEIRESDFSAVSFSLTVT